MNTIFEPQHTKRIKKIDCLSCNKNGLIVVQNSIEMSSISYSDIVKVYIKKQKLEPKIKFGILLVLLLALATSMVYLPMEMVLISLFLYLPIFAWMYDFKSYRLQLIDKSQTLYFKKFSSINKQEHIDLVNTIRKEIFEKRTNHSPDPFQAKSKVHQSIDDIYVLQSLRIV
ncbi:hypothetical protein [Flavobacterium nackdongense]|uniref:Uncharacterized protein n=1 Tax=Flavobacterium nackdongense TaxID=2547394 RepID=A0A4V1AGF6_9FLAO|nr:hypothetical protein [Flavobacterium nackdongense]QBN17872.1 hypothetical protein E1750_03325 [Flavobacterium nackdongense]